MRTSRQSLLGGCAAIVVAGMAISRAANAQIVINGTYDPAFGAPLAVDQVPTSAGDSTTVATNQGYSDGSELDATYGTIQNNTLYLFFAGNLGGTDNLDIFIQTGTGGSNQFQQYIGTTPNSGKNVPLNRLSGVWTGSTNRGLQFDSGFAPNYALTINSPGGSPTDTHNADFNSYMNYVNINTGVDGFLGYGNPGTPGTYNNNQSGSQNVLGISYGFNNSNTAGVTSTSVGNPSAVTTGFEFAIPLANITEAGQAAPSTVEVAAIMDNNGRDTVYNQVARLAPGYVDENNQTTVNNTSLGDPTYATGTNFNNDPGIHYVTIANLPGSTWRLSGSGDWNLAGDWANATVPNAAGATANFESSINSAQTVYSNTPVTVGTINFNNANTYVLAGAGSLTLQASTGGAQINVLQGSHIIQLPTVFASNTALDVASGSTLSLTNSVTVNSGTSVTQSGGGVVNYSNVVTLKSGASLSFAGTTTANTLSIAATAQASLSGSGSVLTLNNLSLATGGTLNIGNSKVLINYAAGGDPIASISAMIASGYNGGAWNGAGITSTNAATQHASFGIAYADSADPGNPAGLASNQIEILYTLLGDANLDGKVNGADFAILATNFNKQVGGWDAGDFNYDHKANGADFASLAANFNKGTSIPSDVSALSAFAEANGLSLNTSVPEPASLGLLALAGIGTMARRRRR